VTFKKKQLAAVAAAAVAAVAVVVAVAAVAAVAVGATPKMTGAVAGTRIRC
jgi:hypothetical protein